jgi:hypothetical protein
MYINIKSHFLLEARQEPDKDKNRKTRRGSIDTNEIDKLKEIDFLEKSKTMREYDIIPG